MKIFNKLYELLGVGFSTILCGDFNTDIKDRVAQNNIKITREGSLLKQMCDDCGVKDSFRELYPLEEELEEFFSSIPKIKSMDLPAIVSKITNKEIIEVIKNLNDKKSPGPDGLPAELYKVCINEIVDLLREYYNEGLAGGNLNECFYQSVITLVYKKGNPADLDNWRQIHLLNMDYKILAKIMANRISQYTEEIIEHEQTCAMKGRFMWDNLGILKSILNSKSDKDIFVVSLDQKKAFDLISRDYLWKAMEHYGFPIDFIQMVQLLYKKSKTKINVNGVLTEEIDIKRGVKQGCPLSAILYILAISPLLNQIKNDNNIEGIQTKEKSSKLKLTAYADDITVFIKNQNELNVVNEHFKRYERVAGAKINLDKTEAVWLGNETTPSLNIQIKDKIKVIGI
uniref:Reverse transcriptase domain-containing protein n=1 Tax=Astyanax mexicanus TaxID=7994 RepID=A0A8B9HSV8_ASTMX